MSFTISDPRVSSFLVAQQKTQLPKRQKTKKIPQKLSPIVKARQKQLATNLGITTFDRSGNVTNVGASKVPTNLDRIQSFPSENVNISTTSPDPRLETAIQNQINLEERNKDLANLQQALKVNQVRNLNFGVSALQGELGGEVPSLGKDLQQRGTKKFISETVGDVKNPSFTFGSARFGDDGGVVFRQSTKGFLESPEGRQQLAERLPSQENILNEISRRETKLGLKKPVPIKQDTVDIVAFDDGRQIAVTEASRKKLEQRGLATLVDAKVPRSEIVTEPEQSAVIPSGVESNFLPFTTETPVQRSQATNIFPFPLTAADAPERTLSLQNFASPSIPQAERLEPTSGGEVVFPSANVPRPESVGNKIGVGFGAGIVGTGESFADLLVGLGGQTVKRDRDLAGPLASEGIFGIGIGLPITLFANLGQTPEVLGGELQRTFDENVSLIGRSGELIREDPFFQIPTVVGAGAVEIATLGRLGLSRQIIKEGIKKTPEIAKTIGRDVVAVAKSPTQPIKITKQITKLESTANKLDSQNNRLEQILEKQIQGKRPSKTDENFLNKVVGKGGDKSPANVQKIIQTNEDVIQSNRQTVRNLKSPPKTEKSSFEELVGGSGKKGGGRTETSIDDAIRGFTKNVDEQEDFIKGFQSRVGKRTSVKVGKNRFLSDDVLKGTPEPDDFIRTAKGGKQITKQLIKPDLSETVTRGSLRKIDDVFGNIKKTKKGGKGGGKKPKGNAFFGGVVGAGGAGIIAASFLNQKDITLPDITTRFGSGGAIQERLDQLPDTGQDTGQIPLITPDESVKEKQRQSQRAASVFPTPNPSRSSPSLSQPSDQIPRIGLLQLEQGRPFLLPKLQFPFIPFGGGGSSDRGDDAGDFKFFRVFAAAKEPFGRTELPLGGFVDSTTPIQEISDVLSSREILEENRRVRNPLRAPRNIVDEENFEDIFTEERKTKKKKDSFIFDDDLFGF